ncbi:hypothetical protein ALC53_03965 [Atta colombica]|uniref:Uncharacterized protein n=1 Tax=Atta colombica TaxID=520822 RepID=A0A195BLE2_9HYME|nr:hypothetical protein ALC53_03965 [Atta colombica]
MLSGALDRIRVQTTWRKVRWCYDSGFQARRVLRNDSSAVVLSETTSVSAPIVCCYSFATSFSSTSLPVVPFVSSSSFSVISLLTSSSFFSSTSSSFFGDYSGDEATTIAVAAATATATSQSAGFLAFVRTGDHRVAVEPTGKKNVSNILRFFRPSFCHVTRYEMHLISFSISLLSPPSFLSSSLLQASCYRSRPLRIVMEMFMLVMRELLPFLSLRERDATLTFYELFL